MANRITYGVSVTPIFTHAEAEGLSTDVLATAIGKTLGGSGEVATPTYANDALTEATHTSGTIVTTPASCKGLFIRHMGVDGTGAVTAATLEILIGATRICILDPGAAVFLPQAKSSQAFTGTPSSGTIKVEHAIFD